MVSTRQMATTNGGNISNNNNGANNTNTTNNHNNSADESVRIPVVTRQGASAYLLVKCYSASGRSLIPPRNVYTAAAAAAATELAPSTSAMAAATAAAAAADDNSVATIARHSILTQAIKTGGQTQGQTRHLLDLPPEILTKIFEYIGYKRIGHLRLVSVKMNDICVDILNSTFAMLIAQTYNRFQAIKANMPRRESARRNHPLACECDIVETCYMRLSLLQMTFSKHIERGHCCFFPGAILDEVYTILHYIKNTPQLERPYRVTDELFDLSTMAMEYFRDRIEPTLPGIGYFKQDFFKLPNNIKRPALVVASDLSDNADSLPSPPQSNMVLRKGIRKIKQGMKIYNNQLSVLRCELRTCKRKSSEQGKQIAEQQKLLSEQQKQTLEYANRLDENDKKNEEMSRKFSTLLQELNKCKTELQYWRSKSPATPTCKTCGQKVAPLLPPEDYQALINQGVKPEDIILNLNDDVDTDNNVDYVCENSQTSLDANNDSNDFVFPDETTTAKLLAANTATAKQLKRRNNNVEPSINNAPLEFELTIDNDTSNNQTIITNCTATNMNGCIESSAVAAGIRYSANSNVQLADDINIDIPTKLFYGTTTNVHKGVIVSPASLLSVKTEPFDAGGRFFNMDMTEMASANAVIEEFAHVAHLQSLNGANHETKKARRVQKPTRCLSGSGKRNK